MTRSLRWARTGAWLDLARAGNFPSVWSNVLAALVLSASAGAHWPEGRILLLALLAGTLAYAGGTTLNDVADAGFDRRHRPARPIPQGLVSLQAAAMAGAVQLAVAFGIFVFVLKAASLWAGALALTIVAYDWLHKRWTGSVLLMAGCRVLLGLTVASLPGHGLTPALQIWLVALFAYIIAISLLARAEYRAGSGGARFGRWVGRLLALMPLLDAIALLAVGAFAAALTCAFAIVLGRIAQRLAASN